MTERSVPNLILVSQIRGIKNGDTFVKNDIAKALWDTGLSGANITFNRVESYEQVVFDAPVGVSDQDLRTISRNLSDRLAARFEARTITNSLLFNQMKNTAGATAVAKKEFVKMLHEATYHSSLGITLGGPGAHINTVVFHVPHGMKSAEILRLANRFAERFEIRLSDIKKSAEDMLPLLQVS